MRDRVPRHGEALDPGRDLAAVSLVASTPSVLAVTNTLPAKSVKELIAIAKAKPELLERQKDSLGRALAEDEIRYAQLRTRIQSLDGREAIAEAEQAKIGPDPVGDLFQGGTFCSAAFTNDVTRAGP